jgi:Zn-finger nucleic acid-binding protein
VLKKLRCPKCENSELTRVAVQLVDVDQYPKCEGVWFDNSAPELLDVLRTGTEKLPESLRKSLTPDHPRLGQDRDRDYLCPRCGARMNTYWYGGEQSRTFLVDGCSKGCGFWLDDGELGQAFDFLKRTRKNDE